MREWMLLCKSRMCGRELDFIKPVLAEDWAESMGPDVTAFEKELGKVVGADNVVALESGTFTIYLALILWGCEIRR